MKNRIIKFRIWDNTDENFWTQSSHHFVCLTETGTVWIKDFFKFLNNPKRYVVQQFTGLLDKNGKEIYESDVVQFKGNYKDYPWRVIWDTTYAGFKLTASGDDADWLKLSDVEKIEIVGNIFENAELVKQLTVNN